MPLPLGSEKTLGPTDSCRGKAKRRAVGGQRENPAPVVPGQAPGQPGKKGMGLPVKCCTMASERPSTSVTQVKKLRTLCNDICAVCDDI